MNKKELRVIVPEKLYNEFKEKCQSEYKTTSEVVRDNMLKYIKGEIIWQNINTNK